MSGRTPQADAILRRAHDEAYRLLDDPVACVETFAPQILAAVAPEDRTEALHAFRRLLHDPKGRFQVVLMAYTSALRLYEAGAFDEELEPA